MHSQILHTNRTYRISPRSEEAEPRRRLRRVPDPRRRGQKGEPVPSSTPSKPPRVTPATSTPASSQNTRLQIPATGSRGQHVHHSARYPTRPEHLAKARDIQQEHIQKHKSTAWNWAHQAVSHFGMQLSPQALLEQVLCPMHRLPEADFYASASRNNTTALDKSSPQIEGHTSQGSLQICFLKGM